jgi:voltage-gated potassium channel
MNELHRQHGMIFRSRFLLLLVSLLIYIVITPFLENFIGIQLLLDVFLTLILLSAIFAVSQDRREKTISFFIAGPLVIFIWLAAFFKISHSFYFINTVVILFFLFCIISILSFVFRQKEITQEVVSASVVVYLMIGISWAFVYAMLEQAAPGSFKIGDTPPENLRVVFSYYSFVTLTTLGYGDVTPLTSRAASLSIAEALIGQLYLAVLVARIVGLHISQSLQKQDVE